MEGGGHQCARLADMCVAFIVAIVRVYAVLMFSSAVSVVHLSGRLQDSEDPRWSIPQPIHIEPLGDESGQGEQQLYNGRFFGTWGQLQHTHRLGP